MSDAPKVVDGADRRKVRLLELLHFIHTQGGATSNECLSFMTIRYGLRRETSAKYLQELHLANLILIGPSASDKWMTTGNYRKLAKHLYGE